MELCEKYLSVPVIFGHMGGSNWIDVIDFAKSHKYVYLDLSAAFASIATRIAISELPERCLYSSDAPYGEPYLYRQLIEFVSPSQEVANMVLGNNILQLLSE
jgi:Predicted metal-dependent hydrolase of the TIM-barrel fold